MAGYVFAIGSDIAGPEAVIRECVQEGVYSTYVRSISSLPFEGTLVSLVSLTDTTFSIKRRVEKKINHAANQLEMRVDEKKKKEYFKLLRITEEELAILPETE